MPPLSPNLKDPASLSLAGPAVRIPLVLLDQCILSRGALLALSMLRCSAEKIGALQRRAMSPKGSLIFFHSSNLI